MKQYPLSRGQERLWFEDRFEPGMPTYNISYCFRLAGPLSIVALQESLQTVMDRHEVLRSIFREADDQLVQVVQDYSPETFSFIDRSALPEGERSDHALHAATQEARTPFDLCRGPLVRVKVQRLTANDHILSFTFHHAVTDGWSTTVFFKEFSEIYQAYSTGRKPSLPAVPIQYGEYARRERESTQDASMARNLAYWQGHLGGTLSPLDLPTDRARPAVRRSVGSEIFASVDPVLLGKLRSVSSKNGATLFMLLLAAFKTLLYRYTGQEDILVGTPIVGRGQLELLDSIGFFVNTIVLRTSLEENPPFLDLLNRVRETTLGALDHQDFPFEELVRVLQVDRDLSRTPLYQVMFVQEPAGESPHLSGVSVQKVSVGNGGAKCDLTLFVRESREDPQIGFEYSTDLFDEATIRRMAGHYTRLLEGIASNPMCRLNELPILTETERRQILIDWCSTEREYPRDSTIHKIFEEEVALNGSRTALISGDVHITYCELNRRANQLAHRLQREGIGQGTPVALCMERSIDMVVGMLGILKAGGAYVPLDPEYPNERLRYMLQDGNIRVVVTHSRWFNRMASDSVRAVCLDVVGGAIAEESGDNPRIGAPPDSLAYIIYTSGTTGRPKGVCVPHRGVVRLVRGNPYASFGPDEVFLQLASFSFDASTFEIWGSLLNGAQLVIPPAEFPTHDELGRIIGEAQVTTLWLTAGLFHNLVDVKLEAFAGLQQLLIGGDVVSPSHSARFKTRYPDCKLINGYGPTENTTFTCCCEISGDEVGAVPLGRPIGNTSVYILDRDLQPVPIGVIGELCIAGDGLARGYLNDEKLTAEKFVPNPFGNPTTPTLYRSGDRARYRSDGVVMFEGRQDNQVKANGYRIEPGEIETVLRSYPGLAQVFVQARPSPDGEKRLVAYCVPDAGMNLTVVALRRFLYEKLPKYMVPSSFVVLPKLPLNSQGKVDRHALPEPQPTDGIEGKVRTPPSDPLERMLASIWRKLFAVESVGVNENFFELGGHSLMALRFFGELEKSTGVQLPLATLFAAPTIRQLATIVREKGWQPPWSCLVPIKPSGTRPPLFFVHGVGGNILIYSDLARCVSEEQPVYGIQSLGLDGRQAPLTRVEDMAARYIQEIRMLQPTGPYLLCGLSFGGTVAFEMARQLSAQGERVGMLGLLDTFVLPDPESPIQSIRISLTSFGRRARFHIGNLTAVPPARQISYLQQAAKRFRRRIWGRFWRVIVGLRKPGHVPVEYLVRMVRESNTFAARKYRAAPYDGEVTLFVATDQILKSPFVLIEAWQPLAKGGVREIRVPGDHVTMVREPHVKELAKRLDECLIDINRASARD
jgi:amino acid adenylation domain-containing protein